MSDELVIDVQGLTKRFGDRTVVDGVDLRVKRGEIYGFLGPNGSGKTTTIRMLCGLLIPDAGSGTCLGYDVITQARAIKMCVGYMTQKFSFYEDLTIRENLEFVARMYQIDDGRKRVGQTLDELGFGQRGDQLAGSLSGGWKQRLALSACLLHDPDLLLLDEPTAGVDPKARRAFWDQIYELSQRGVTTLVSTHYMDEAERCNQLAYIAYSQLLMNGTREEVIQAAGLSTWIARGDGLAELAKTLRGLPGLDQIALFGHALHVSGTDRSLMHESLKPFIDQKRHAWEESQASLEDVFISAVSHVKDNFAS